MSFFALAAHFYRAGNLLLVVLMAASPLLLFIRASWIVRLIQVELIMGGIEWIRTIIKLVKIRQANNMPWERLAMILGCVAVFTLLSARVFNFRNLQTRIKRGRDTSQRDVSL